MILVVVVNSFSYGPSFLSHRLLKKPSSPGYSKRARCKAPESLSPAVQAGNPESGVTTNKE